jgi:hypothetical protein
MDITRSQFLRLFAGAGAGALALSTLGACDDAGDKAPDAPPGNADAPPADAPPIDSPPMTNCQQNGTMATIGTNHGHAFAMMVTKEDVIAGQEKTYDIQGVSQHPHTVTVTAAMFAMLQQNMQVTVTSSEDAGHTHVVTIRCA